MHRVIELVIRAAEAGQLQVDRLGPVTQAAAGLKTITPAQVLVLAAIEVELVAHDQAGATAFGQLVKRWASVSRSAFSVAIDSSEFCKL